MSKYVLIESRDPFDCPDTEQFAEIAKGLAANGNETTLFLLQNGVLAARKGNKHEGRFSVLASAGVKVLADGFAIRERAITSLADGVEVVEIGTLVKLIMEPGTKTIWH